MEKEDWAREAWDGLGEDARVSARGIEVGHIFHFGTKYSEPMNAYRAGARRQAAFRLDGFLRHRAVAPARCHHRGLA
jgi:prolyl-tRNA synthetase